MFRALGMLVLLYVAYALSQGVVRAKDGLRWRFVYKDESPGYFFAVISIYTLLGLALIFVF